MTTKAKYLFVFSASLTTAILAAVALITPSDAGGRHVHPSSGDGTFVAHEWGTFTSVQGSDGVILDGLQHEEEHLPSFVHAVTSRTTSPFADLGDGTQVVPVRQTRGKMETPVIYFYTDRTRKVRVRVSYTQGLLSHFFPKPSATEGIGDSTDELDLSKLVSTSAEWNVNVVPPREASKTLPKVEAGNLYGFARDVKAAFVESGEERERFIFYRGLGHNPPAVNVHSTGDWGHLANNTGGRIPAAFALEMNEDTARFAAIDPTDAGITTSFNLSATKLRPKQQVIRDLERAVETALVAQGLYGDESAAMVKTWSSSWFGDVGTRVLYLVPNEATERLLPLEISPKPDKLVRVLVGRVEYMTHAQELAIGNALIEAAASDDQTAKAGMKKLAGLGRFLEPKLRRAVTLATDDTVRQRGLEILSQLGN